MERASLVACSMSLDAPVEAEWKILPQALAMVSEEYIREKEASR